MTKSSFLKPTILSLSFLSILSGAAVSPALGRIQLAFPDASPLAIQMILTLPPLFIIPFSLLTGRISLILRKRHILFVGLIIYLLAGVGGGLMNNMTMILVMRALLGVGTGLISALSLSLIADFYHGEARSSTMGLSSAIATMGGIVLTLLSGWLALFSWRFAFAVYLVSLIALILVYFFLPEPPISSQDLSTKPGKLPFGVYGMGFLTILLMIVFYLIPTQIALFIQDAGIGDAGQSGIYCWVGVWAHPKNPEIFDDRNRVGMPGWWFDCPQFCAYIFCCFDFSLFRRYGNRHLNADHLSVHSQSRPG